MSGCGHLHLPPAPVGPAPTAREVAERHAREIIDAGNELEAVDFVMRYSNDTDAIDLTTRWHCIAGEWRITNSTTNATPAL